MKQLALGTTILLFLFATGAASGQTETLRDEFSVKSYGNNDGTADWRSEWFEAGDSGGADSGAIIVGIRKGALRLTKNDRSVARSAYLGGATGVTLSFDYGRQGFANADQYVTLEILRAGEFSWNELDRFEGPADDAGYVSVSYGITAFASDDMAIRFSTSAAMNATSIFRVDNLEIEYTPGFGETIANWPTASDFFNAQAYDNDDGTVGWASDWVEGGDDGSPLTGNVNVQANVAGALRVSERDNSAERVVDLSSADFATLTFDRRRVALDSANDYVVLEISSDGGTTWTELDRFAGPDNDNAYQLARYFITPYLAPDTTIRFRSAPTSMNSNDRVFFDNVRVLYHVP